MNRYKVVIMFTNDSKFTTYLDSNLTLEKFTDKFNAQYQDNKNNYISFTGDVPMTMINKDNVTFYTIEQEK